MNLILSLLFTLVGVFAKEKVPGNLSDLTICKVSHLGLEYLGDVAKTESNVRCQSWNSNSPHVIKSNVQDDAFPEGSRKNAKNYCRNPTKDPTGPWCYTLNDDLMYETCGLPLCSLAVCKLTGPGMEYGGIQKHGVSDNKCLKWDKTRKKVKNKDSFIKIEKFPKMFFPENSISNAQKYCRNPNGDIGGPWCFIENDELDIIEKEYCDISFCDEPDCMVFSKNHDTYFHYIQFDPKIDNLTFGIKIWDPDSYLQASARLSLTLLALPLTGKEIEDAGIGIEIYLSNNYSSLTFGNKESSSEEVWTRGILKSTEYTYLSLSWHAGFISLSYEGQIKSIFLSEYKTKNTLLSHQKDSFNFYSTQGTNVLWSFPFCIDDICDIHVTTGNQFQNFWLLREVSAGYDLKLYVRAVHSATILLTPTPTNMYPNVKIIFNGADNFTKILLEEYDSGPVMILKELEIDGIVNYWEWREFSITVFGDNLNIYAEKTTGTYNVAEIKNYNIRHMRWYSVASENTVVQWIFFCKPSDRMKPPNALLPECAMNKEEPNYKGTQDVTHEGLPCLPWSGKKIIPEDVESLFFQNETVFHAWNYCRDPLKANEGTYCYVMTMKPQKLIKQAYCRLRKCKSEQCKTAGTGNDFVGAVSTTRSNRTCDRWQISTVKRQDMSLRKVWNYTMFPDLKVSSAENFCRNPALDISGSWCYTTDSKTPIDVCNVRDCDKREECIIITNSQDVGRKIYILPQWKEHGIHGGLQFSLKQWDPDMADGVILLINAFKEPGEIQLHIGAENNEKIMLYYNGQLLVHKTFPHIISAGKWTDFWLQMRKGEILLGFKGIPDALFEWKLNEDEEKGAFEPTFLSYRTILAQPIGIFFKCDECYTENVTVSNFHHVHPIGLWSITESNMYRKISLTIRGTGVTLIKLIHISSFNDYALLELNPFKSRVSFTNYIYGVKGKPVEKHVENLYTPKSWSDLIISFKEEKIQLLKDDKEIFAHNSDTPLIYYTFSIGSARGWVTWSANCPKLDIDGPPKDGGWSKWSSWTCTVTCGGGEGFRTRQCSNPHPNIFGKLCHGPPIATGKCNDFPCGDVSPQTLETIREHVKQKSNSYVIKKGHSITLNNDKELLRLISKESPEAFYEWTLNGAFIEAKPRHIVFQGEDVVLTHAEMNDTGVYVCMLHRINKHRVILKAISLSVINDDYDIVTRATRSYILQCNAVVLGYMFSNLNLKIMHNDHVFIDHGTTVLAAVNSYNLENLNTSNTGHWKCVVEQKDLKFSWVTNYVKIHVKKTPNMYTNLMEDELTAPLFSWLKTEKNVLAALIVIVVSVILIVCLFVFIYFRFCTLKFKERKKYTRLETDN